MIEMAHMSTDERVSAEIRVGQREMAERRRRSRDVHRPRYVVMSVDDIGSILPMRNQVLAKVIGYSDSRYVDSGGSIIDIMYSPNENLGSWVEVVQVPLSYGLVKVGDSRVDMELDCGMRLRVGDKCYVRYLGLVSALGLGDVKGDKRSFADSDGNYYALLNYGDFIFRRGIGGGCEMLNGWVALSSVEAGHVYGGVEHLGCNVSVKYGRVESIGVGCVSGVEEYSPDVGDVEVGDYVAYTEGGDIRFDGVDEFGDKVMYRCPMRHLVARFCFAGRPVSDSEAVKFILE